jgi:hypothetical protein
MWLVLVAYSARPVRVSVVDRAAPAPVVGAFSLDGDAGAALCQSSRPLEKGWADWGTTLLQGRSQLLTHRRMSLNVRLALVGSEGVGV